MSVLFDLGELVMTAGVAEFMSDYPEFAKFCLECLQRYVQGDWGEMDDFDKEMNDDAVRTGERILASYPIPNDIPITWEEKIWIITEWDRSCTTILFPDEY